MEYRLIDSGIWDLSPENRFFLDLATLEKALFIFLFSNRFTHISGLYLLPFEQIKARFADLSEAKLLKMLRKLEQSERICYDRKSGIILVKSLLRRQVKKINPAVANAVKRQLALFAGHPLAKKFREIYDEFGEAPSQAPRQAPIEAPCQAPPVKGEREKEKGEKEKEKGASPCEPVLPFRGQACGGQEKKEPPAFSPSFSRAGKDDSVSPSRKENPPPGEDLSGLDEEMRLMYRDFPADSPIGRCLRKGWY